MFEPTDWYWIRDNGTLYSSSAMEEVPASHDAYIAWVAAGNVPTRWPQDDTGRQTDDALRVVLAQHWRFFSAKDQKLASVNDKREAVISAGYRHNFGGTIGTRILDQRGPEDVTSWLALKLMAQDLNSADQGDTMLKIRDANNATFSAKSTAVEAAMSDMGTWRVRILAWSWALKDAIAAAPDQAELDAIDINDGWPE